MLPRVKPRHAAVARQAARQHGVFTRQDAVRLGLSDDMLGHLVASGWCRRVALGVYRIVGAPQTPDQLLFAAVAAHGPDAVASHRSAARLWQIPGFKLARPEITLPHVENRRRRLGTVHGSLLLPPRHITVRNSIRVTTAARTLFDLAGHERVDKVGRSLDDAVHRGLCTLRQVNQVFFVLAGRGRTGTVAMRRLLEARGEGHVPPASDLERRARKVFGLGGLSMPEFEVQLGDDEFIGRVDCYWRAAKLVVELDSRKFHGGLHAREADRNRDNRLMASGWRVIRVTWDDLRDRPNETVDLIRRALDGPAPLNWV